MPIIPNQPSLRPTVICAHSGFHGAKAPPEILPNQYYVSRWQISGRRFGPRSGACDPATKARKRFNTHRVRSGSVQCILSAVLRHDSCRTPEELSGRSTTDRILSINARAAWRVPAPCRFLSVKNHALSKTEGSFDLVGPQTARA